MTTDTQIEPGDVVNVFFNAQPGMHGMTVRYAPSATGDSWHLQDKDGTVIYVQQFDYMIRTHKRGAFQP